MDRTARHISEFVARSWYGALPARTVDVTKRHLLDSLGCSIAGYDSEPAAIARRAAARVTSSVPARLFRDGRAASTEMAAFANTAALRYLDFNDTYISKSGLHPSDVIPALIALGEACSASGAELITAIACAYDILGAFADGTDIRERGWDQGILIAIAVDAAGAKLAGGGETEIGHAASLAATSDVPTRQTRVGQLAMWKGCATAAAARNGLFAAHLAVDGMTGPAAAFDGYHGLAEQVTGPLELQLPEVPGVTIGSACLKFHPSEYHSQASLDLLAVLRQRVQADDVESLRIGSYWVVVDEISEPDKWKPTSRETADHSLPFLAATMLVHGEVWIDSYTADRLRDPVVLALMKRTTVVERADFTTAYLGDFLTEYDIVMRSGVRIRERTTHPCGHPRNPMTEAEVTHKFARLSKPILPEGQVAAIASSVRALETLDVRDLVDKLIVAK
jgi:2-methylcitrate dehydratase